MIGDFRFENGFAEIVADTYEWLIIIIAIAIVIAAEMANTAVEYLCDHVTKEYNDAIKAVKDITAGAVLITAIGSFII